jgi:Family of unknown function (DUF6325)
MTGPVQVVVVGFERPAFSGEVMAELDRLGRAGTVRLLDVLLLARAEDGTFEMLPMPTPPSPGLGTLAAEILGGAGPGVADATEPPDGSGWSLADAIPAGGTAAVALIEHLWATPLRDAIQRSGGTALEETWLAREDIERLAALIEEPRA